MKNLKRVIILTIITVLFLGTNIVKADDISIIEQYLKDNDLYSNKISTSDIITMYQDLSKEYSNDEIAKMINENSDKIEERGINSKTLSTVETLINSTDAETLNDILEDVNVEKIKEKIDNGATTEEILKDVQENMTTRQKVSTVGKLALSNKILKNVLIIWILISLYMILIRGVIYKKAGEAYWTTFIPFYRDAVLFKICGYSAWWLLLLIIPIVGWIMYGILKIIMNFELSKAFGKNALFGICLWIFKPIFESLVAFSSKCKFIDFE